ncbi:MAG: 5-deoxy-glucuronate isomerase [Thermomicrobiales bacterium]|nr:5-deoxy-glucuronate isomerase [Thermomicrobiales bacterium]
MELPDRLLVHSSGVEGNGIALDISVESAGWEYCGLTVWTLEPGGLLDAQTGADEVCIVLLGGDCTVSAGGQEFRLDSRPSIFAGKTSSVYVPIDSSYQVVANDATQVAVCKSRATRSFPVRYIGPEDVPVEIRGAGNAARQINHIIKPDFPADTLLVVEVFTPSGNWSSYPPHKHDVSRMPAEADLEEIYYYRIEPADGFAFQRLYTADGAIDQPYIIRDGDALLMPEGYHAYAVAHGYTGYYLNILAGDEPVRTMQPFDDPTYGWVRGTWSDSMNEGLSSWQDIDDRINGAAGKKPVQ